MGRALLVALVLGALAAPPVADAQDSRPRKPARIGRLSPLSAEADAPNLGAFRPGLRELGWVEGQDFAIEARFAAGRPDRLGPLAAELVRQQVDVIVVGSTPGALAASQATSAIPIVMVTTGDPIEGGLVASLAHPGRNLTGVTALGQVLSAKRLVCYGASLADMYHRAAVYADKILRGARPADLPVEQPTKLELVINLRTARGLGLAIPASVLSRADHVLE